MNLRNLISSTILNTRRHMRRTFLFLRRRTYPVQNRTSRFWRRYRNILGPSVFLLIVYASFHLLPSIQAFLESHFSTNQEIERLRALLLNTGSALMGAAAIVTSLVLFAMQVNIERMPYGLFRRLSADAMLLGAFNDRVHACSRCCNPLDLHRTNQSWDIPRSGPHGASSSF